MGRTSLTLRNELVPQTSRTSTIRGSSGIAATAPGASVATTLTELPFKWLFAAASEPVLIAEAATLTIAAANPAAATLLATTRHALIGTPLLQAVDPSCVRTLQSALACVRSAGRSQPISLRARGSGEQLGVKVSIFHICADSYLLVRLSPSRVGHRAPHRSDATSLVLDLVEHISVGFVLTDCNFRVEYANRAFIEMIGGVSLEHVRCKSLQHWLEITAHDSTRLRAQMSQRQAVTVLSSRVHSNCGATQQVRIRAVAVPDEQNPCWGFCVDVRPSVN